METKTYRHFFGNQIIIETFVNVGLAATASSLEKEKSSIIAFVAVLLSVVNGPSQTIESVLLLLIHFGIHLVHNVLGFHRIHFDSCVVVDEITGFLELNITEKANVLEA